MVTTVSIGDNVKKQIEELIKEGPYRSISDFVQKWAWIGIMVHTGKANIDLDIQEILESTEE